jgi:predicted metal-dependent phosphoesterase TrpH
MPARQPFTALCRTLARPRYAGRADLHAHTTASDGAYTPAQLVDLARRSGLSALAITDHDTLAGIAPARAAAGKHLEIVAGVEITAEWRGQELHLLGYFVDEHNPALRDALEHLQAERVGRFLAMLGRLRALDLPLEVDVDTLRRTTSLGRRHLAQFLVDAGHAATIGEAFQRWLADDCRACVAKTRLPVAAAIALVRGAGGVASWAHPPYDATKDDLRALQADGLQALEVDYPTCRLSRGRELRGWAQDLCLAVTGGSDCHGPDQPSHALGACGVTALELAALRTHAAFSPVS